MSADVESQEPQVGEPSSEAVPGSPPVHSRFLFVSYELPEFRSGVSGEAV